MTEKVSMHNLACWKSLLADKSVLENVAQRLDATGSVRVCPANGRNRSNFTGKLQVDAKQLYVELKYVWDGHGFNAISYSEFQHLIALATTIPTNRCSWANGKKYTLTLPTASSSELKGHEHEHGSSSNDDEVIQNVARALIDMVMIIVVSKEVLGKAVLDREAETNYAEVLEVPTLTRDLFEAYSQSNVGVDDDCCDDNRISEAAGCSARTDRILSSGMASTSGHNIAQKQDQHVHHELRRSGRKRTPTGRYTTNTTSESRVKQVDPVGQRGTNAGEQGMADSRIADIVVDVGQNRDASASSERFRHRASGYDINMDKPSSSWHPKGLPPLILQTHPRAGERSKNLGESIAGKGKRTCKKCGELGHNSRRCLAEQGTQCGSQGGLSTEEEEDLMNCIDFKGPEDITFSERFRAKFEQWRLDEADMIPGMMCCSFCGVTEFGGVSMGKDAKFTLCKPIDTLPAPPYFFGNQAMREYMVRKNGDGVEKWLQCRACKVDKAKRKRLHYVVQCSPAYQEALLSTHPLVVQTTSVTDVSINMVDRLCGHAKGEVRTDSVLMSAPLISRGPLLPTHASANDTACNDHNLKLLLGTLKQGNALVQQCFTLAEKCTPGTHGLPLLPPETIAAIAEDFRSGAPVFDNGCMEACVMPEVFSLVATCDAQPQPAIKAPTGFRVGNIKLRNSGEDLDLITNSCGLPLNMSRKRGRCMLEGDDGSDDDGEDDAAPATTATPVTLNKQPALEQVTLELAVFCVSFPHAMGYFKGDTRLGDYLFYRMSCGFSNFTLYKPYLMLMFLVRQCNMLHSQCGKAVLEKDMAAFKKKNPDQNEEEAVRHAMKHVLPATIPGSPAWHYNALQDLLAVVNENGMPDLFWTVTMDEVSELKWQPVKDMEALMKNFCNSMSFKDAPVECARLFDEKLQRAIKQWLFIKGGKQKGVLGRVKDYLIRYEVQDRGSVHAHVIFWLHDEDVEAACSKIRSCMPAAWDDEADKFVRPTSDPLAALLFDIVHRKQRHVCTAVGAPGCRHSSPMCINHFPQPQQLGYAPVKLDDNHWHCYFCPRGGVDGPDRNVGPYIPELTMVMNSHQNMQKIIDTAWSFYLLKYAMKAEASGHLNIDPNMVTRIGLEGLSEAQCQVATATWMTKPVVATEAALIMLRIKMVQGSRQVISISTAPPSIRMKRMSRGNKLCLAPVDKYMARPSDMENLTMIEYLRKYDVSQIQIKRSATKLAGRDSRGGYVYEREPGTIVRFTDYNPKYSPEGFFYNLLVGKLPFRDEAMLMPHDQGGSYLSQCHLTLDPAREGKHILEDEEDLMNHVQEYSERHMYSSDKLGQLFEEMSTTFGVLPDTLGNILDTDQASHQSASTTPAATVMTTHPHQQACLWSTEFNIDSAPPLFPEQQAAFDSITATQCGLLLLTGGPGSGKTHLTQRLAHAFASGGRSVLLSATTGAAAVNLSKSASTVHDNFVIPVTGFFRPLPMHSVKRLLLKEAKIFIIDEMSMLTHATLNNVLNRLMQIHNVSSFAEVLQKVVVLLVGDHAQLPPVCQHIKTVTRARQQHIKETAQQQNDEDQEDLPDMSLCQRCHLAYSPHWKDMTKYYLSCQPRFDDPGYAEFLNLMRCGQPTQSQVDEALSTLNGVTYITKEEARQMVGAHCRALCTHKEDVAEYNHHAVLNSFSPAMQVPVSLYSSALDVPEMASWVADPKFYRFKHVAIGCKVSLLDNIQVSKGAANGSTGTVTALEFLALPAEGQQRSRGPKKFVVSNLADLPLDAGDLYAIHVKLDSTSSERTIRVTRSDYVRLHGVTKGTRGKKPFWKAFFPLTLAYALTAHRAQGATITDNVIIDVRSAFAPGLLYVMLSRVKNRKQLFIVGCISASMCAPIQLPLSTLGTAGD